MLQTKRTVKPKQNTLNCKITKFIGYLKMQQFLNFKSNVRNWEVVVAQLVEWSLPSPEVRGPNPVNAKFIMNVYCLLFWKVESNEKRGRECPISKKKFKTFCS